MQSDEEVPALGEFKYSCMKMGGVAVLLALAQWLPPTPANIAVLRRAEQLVASWSDKNPAYRK